MRVKVGDTGIITFGDETTSRVVISKIHTYPATGMPADIVLTYLDDETHRPLVHPDFIEHIDGRKVESFPLPEEIFEQVFLKD